jgi:hypothetical protein
VYWNIRKQVYDLLVTALSQDSWISTITNDQPATIWSIMCVEPVADFFRLPEPDRFVPRLGSTKLGIYVPLRLFSAFFPGNLSVDLENWARWATDHVVYIPGLSAIQAT